MNTEQMKEIYDRDSRAGIDRRMNNGYKPGRTKY